MPRARTKRKRRPAEFAEEERPFVHDEIIGGVAARRVQHLIDRGVLGAKQVYRVIPERTFGRRLAKGEPLKPTEADAIGRLIRVTEEAEKTFGDSDFAHKWLTEPRAARSHSYRDGRDGRRSARGRNSSHAHRLWRL